MNENYKDPKIRNEIKKRLIAEQAMPDLPTHRRHEVEAALFEISCYESHD